MDSYNSLLKAAPPMRLYDLIARKAPNSGFAEKVKQVKSMAAGVDNASSRKEGADASKPKRKTAYAAVRRGGRSGRRTLINVGG
jgi:hypothetical protein